jgi:hypothetical protein
VTHPRLCHKCHTWSERVRSCPSCQSRAFYRGLPLMEFPEVAFPVVFGNGKVGGLVGPALHFDPVRPIARRSHR